MITDTHVIVLKTVDYSESSLIATVLSREHGKIALIAKGARKPKNRFAGKVAPGACLAVTYYYKSTRSVQTLTEASYEQRLDSLATDIEKMSVSMGVLELVAQLVHDGEVNDAIYSFTRQFLSWLNRREEISGSIFPYAQVRLAELAGLGIQLGSSGGGDVFYFNIDAGTLSGKSESTRSIRLKEGQKQFLIHVLQSRKASVLDLSLPEPELRDLIAHLDRYFHYHLEGFRQRRSDSVFDQILRGINENS